jgi:hypothetical protein
MLFWFILLGLSLIGVFTLLFFRLFRPGENSDDDGLLRDHLQKKLGNAKDLVLDKALISGGDAGRGLSTVYAKGLSVIKKTKFPALIRGKGILKKKDVTSNFLRDVKEAKAQVREELANGEDTQV